MSDAAIVSSHNQPPVTSSEEALKINLEERHSAVLARKEVLLEALGRVPEKIEDDETEEKYADFIKQLKKHARKVDGIRGVEKEPHLTAGRIVDGYFKSITTPLLSAAETLNKELTRYQRERALNERLAREAEQRRLEAEARRKQQEAEEAERVAREAEAERIKRDETRRTEIEAANAAREAASLPPVSKRSGAAETTEDADQKLSAAVAAEDAAKMAAEDAVKAASGARSNLADLSRSRTEHGTVASLSTRWVHDESSLDRNTLDLVSLRQHLPVNALHQAVRSFVKAGGRELQGVRIFEDSQAVVR